MINNNELNLNHLSTAFSELVNGKKPKQGKQMAKVASAVIDTSKRGELQVVYSLVILPEGVYEEIRKFTPLSPEKLSFIVTEMKIFQEPLIEIKDLPQALKNITNSIVTIEIKYSDDEDYSFPIPKFINLVARPVPYVGDEDNETLMTDSGAQDQVAKQS